jgi:hypothetical protein
LADARRTKTRPSGQARQPDTGSPARSLAAILEDLAKCDAKRRTLIAELRKERYVRGRGLVGELGEWLAGRYYRVDLARASTPGYDLVHNGLLIQVRALRSTPEHRRTVLGHMREPYDVLLALRFDESYRVTDALEVPRAVLDELFPNGRRVTWTRALTDGGTTLSSEAFNVFLSNRP